MTQSQPQTPATSLPSDGLNGVVVCPGCKSLSHRAVILGLLSTGETRIEALLQAEDVKNTLKSAQALGAHVETSADNATLKLTGTGLGALLPPSKPLDFGNSGTGARLMMGVVAGHGISARFEGDASLSSRPMARILNPLIEMGARVKFEQEDGRLPLTLTGQVNPTPLDTTSPVPSAQLKSAILLAGLTARGITTVREKTHTRDHTERLLTTFGAHIETGVDENGHHTAKVEGGHPLTGQSVIIPADPSSVAFPLVAALICPSSELTFPNVLLNPLRTGLFTTLKEMGANISIKNQHESGGETLGDIAVTSSKLTAVDVPASRAASMIDEYPIAAIAAAYATGTSIFRGLSELRVKECDRLQAVYDGLTQNGVQAEVSADDLIIHGTGQVQGGATVATHHDHRIAMSFLVLGLQSAQPVSVDDTKMINTSFPNFLKLMRTIGARITVKQHSGGAACQL